MSRSFVPSLLAICCGLAFPGVAAAQSCPTSGQPGQVPAAKIVSAGFDAQVSATFCGSNAGYTSDLYLVSPDYQYIATGHVTPSGNTVDLGAFASGDELIFSIYVRNTGLTYYSGPGSRNPDGQVHAAVTDLGGGDYAVGFEDLFGGGDRDYDDIMIVVNADATIVPPDATDTDFDGIPDYEDNCIFVANTDQSDVDGDGIGDTCDDCPADSTNTCAVCDDTDGDGICDEDDACALDAANDADGDGWCAEVDNCVATYNADQTDLDNDGTGDACDDCVDADADGACDGVDNCAGLANADQADADADGAGDACDVCPADADDDADADGICADEDNCASVSNADQADFDGDTVGDACDACPVDALNDIDEDGACGDVDNCPDDANEDQADSDADGAGDACDVCPFDAEDDADGDGYCADVDTCPDLADEAQADADGDGAGDLCDVCPLDADDDADADGVCGDEDACADTVLPDLAPTQRLGTNRWADLDGDGVFDTTGSNGKGPQRSYTIDETAGCSCAQIVDALDLGDGHMKFGCSISAMDEWTALVE